MGTGLSQSGVNDGAGAEIKDVHTAMNAENLVVYHDGKGQEIKHIRKIRPHMGRPVFSDTFRVESVSLA